jgi:putative ABC transport system permease protein
MIGLLEIRRRKLQFALIAAVFALVSYLVLMITGLGIGLNELAGSALLNFDADRLAYADTAGKSVIRSEMSQETVDRVSSAPGVEDTAPLAYVAANYVMPDGEIGSAALLGYDPGTIAEPDVTSGRPLTPEDTNGILADRRFLNDAGLDVGDTVTFQLRLETVEMEIVGEIDEGAFFFQPAIYVLRPTLLDLKYGELPEEARPVASIVLLKGEPESASGEGYEVLDKQTAFNNIEGVQGQSATVTSLQVFGYLVGAMVIGVFFYVLTLQKISQIGMLKAIGASSGFILLQLLVQVLAIAAIGLVVSIGLALLTERAIKGGGEIVPISFTTSAFIVAGVLLLATSALAAFFSGRQVLRTDPIIALGQQL